MEKYEALEMEVIEFEDEDVITTSDDDKTPITGPEVGAIIRSRLTV